MKVLFLKKSIILTILALVIFFTAYSLNLSVLSVGSTYFTIPKKLPIYAVDRSDNKLSISFDAAWGADKTTEIMNICDEYKVKATFFLVGFWIEEYPDKVKEIYNRGFEIGIHSNTHPDMAKLSKTEMKQELSTNIKLIEDLTGFRPKLFRPPYGSYNNKLIEVCKELNLNCIQWDVDSLDWQGISADEITRRVVDNVKNGSIILCHNNSDNIIPALTMVLERLTMQGYKICSIGELIYYENFTIDRNGLQSQNQQSVDDNGSGMANEQNKQEDIDGGNDDNKNNNVQHLDKKPIT